MFQVVALRFYVISHPSFSLFLFLAYFHLPLQSGWFDVGLHFDKEQRFRDMIKLPPGLMTKPMCKKLLGTLGFRTDDSFINFLNRSEFPKVKNKPKNLHADVADISCYPGQISFASDRTENSLIYR